MFKQLRPVNSIGEGWLLVLQEIMDNGVERIYSDILTNGAPVKEVFGLTLTIQQPQLEDPILQKYGDPAEIAWMTDNFSRPGNVPALNDEHSYASRLYHYMGEKNQVAWLVERLKENETIRSATITMLEPLLDQTYIPCVSLLDFQVIDHRLHLIAYCRALDFGKKAYVNMMMLAEIQKHVAEEINCPMGSLTLVMKSAHVYETEYERVKRMLSGEKEQRKPQAQTEWSVMSDQEKHEQLYWKQKELLDTFLAHHTISQTQYDKSLSDLALKMEMNQQKQIRH